MKTLTTFFTLLVITLMTASAQTGSFNTTIPFNAENRTLSCYVPSNYDSTQAYRLMICLHGLGDNSTNYRNALITSFNWPAIYPNTIFVCPDGGSDANKDFYQPKGDQEIVKASIEFAKTKYTIDTQAVVLQGFSLGGRSALKYGLDHPEWFKALLLNTPAMQGLKDVQNDSIASLQFSYDNAEFLPMFITVGESDFTYTAQISALVEILKKNNAPVQFESVPNVGHTIPNSTITQKSYSFLINRNVPHLDADLFDFDDQQHFCSNNLQTTGFVRNNGDSIIHSLSITLSTGNASTVQQWTGTILPNHYAMVPLSLNLPNNGQYLFTASITGVNDTPADSILSNNKLELAIDVATGAAKSIVTQTFDDTSNTWYFHPSGSVFEWYIDDEVSKSGQNSMSSFNTALLFYSRNAIESFSLPAVNIAALSKKELNLDLAFTYYRYTPPYIASETNFADTLEVLISTDCGATFTSIYKKGGQQLATRMEPIVNALSLQACIFTPKADEWRTETIDLTNFATADKAIFKFNSISGMGGLLYLDNLSFGGSYVSVHETTVKNTSFTMYPNPANEYVSIEIPAGASGDITIMDITGKIVSQQTINSREHRIALTDIPEGLYMAQLTFGGQSIVQKLLIRK
ncbi:MAG: T9SS type A sorting domain-containing protein [Bacteroidota bacterium]